MALESVQLRLDSSQYAETGLVTLWVGQIGFNVDPEEIKDLMRGRGKNALDRDFIVHTVAIALLDAGITPTSTLAQIRTAVNAITVRY